MVRSDEETLAAFQPVTGERDARPDFVRAAVGLATATRGLA